MIKGIRGANTVKSNTVDDIREATIELLKEISLKNNVKEQNISHVIFSITSDITSANPAKFAREDFGWKNTALMCFNEAKIDNSICRCIRILIVLNCDTDFKPVYVYLNGASNLRK